MAYELDTGISLAVLAREVPGPDGENRTVHRIRAEFAGRLVANDSLVGFRPLPPPPRTKWTRRVPHPVLIGHVSSLLPSPAPRPLQVVGESGSVCSLHPRMECRFPRCQRPHPPPRAPPGRFECVGVLEPDPEPFNFNASFGALEVCEHEDLYCQRNLRDTLAPNYTVGEFGWNGSSARIIGHTCAKHNFTVPFQDGVAAFSGLYVLDMASDMKLRFTLQSANPASHRRIFLETASFDVPGEPVRIIAKGPVSTSATGGVALAAQPRLEIVDAGGRLTTYDRDVTVTATLRAVRKQAGGCPAGQPFSCLAVSPPPRKPK